MLALKQAIELEFQENWTDTGLHILGFNFDSTGLKEWVKLNVTPISTDILDVSNTLNNETALIEVFCYGKTLHRAIDISDAVEDLVRGATGFDVRTSTSYDQNQLEGKLWYQVVRINAYTRNNLTVLNYLVDGNLDFLVDGAADRLIT